MKLISFNHFEMEWAIPKYVLDVLAGNRQNVKDVFSHGASNMRMWLSADVNGWDIFSYAVTLGEDSSSHSMECGCWWCLDGYLTYPRVRLIKVAPSLLSFETRQGEVITIRG